MNGNNRNEPRATRPGMPDSYGLSQEPPDTSNFSWSKVSEAIVDARNYWVATVRPDGKPHVMPVWGIWLDGTFLFSTGRDSRKGRNLAENPEIVVHLESGDEVVIFEGRVEEASGDELLARYADIYEAKYQFRPNPGNPGEVIYALKPRAAFAWLEKDFPQSATRWVFDQ